MAAAEAKMFATEVCQRVVDETTRIYGGNAFAREYRPQRILREARFLLYGGGTHEVLRGFPGKNAHREVEINAFYLVKDGRRGRDCGSAASAEETALPARHKASALPPSVRNQYGDRLHDEHDGHAAGPSRMLPENAGEDGTGKAAKIIKRDIETRGGGAGLAGRLAHMACRRGLAGKDSGGLRASPAITTGRE